MRHKRAHPQGSAACRRRRVLMCASVASMIDQFNMPNIRLLQEMGYEVHVLCNFLEGNTCSKKRLAEFQAQLRDMGVVQHQWDCPRGLFPIRKCAAAFRQILRLLKEQEYAWMHCHSPVGGALSRIAARRAGVPVIYTAHGFHFYKGAPLKNWLLYYPAERLLACWTDILITVNQEDYRFAERYLKAGRVFYIPGIGIDVEKFRREKQTEQNSGMCFRRKYGIPEHAVFLLSVGELSRRKNHQMVIDVLSALKRKDIYYFICGQGPLKEELSRYAEHLGISAYIRMLGYWEDMTQIYWNADIFVFPSIQEGMPVALMEAMAAGLPCVVSDIRGNRELIEAGRRFQAVHPRQADQLKRTLAELIRNEKLRTACGAYNRKKIESYKLSVVQSRMEVIYAVMQRER